MVQWIQPRSLGQKQQRYDDQNLFLSHDVLLHNTLNSLKQQNTLLLDPPVKFYFPRALIYQKGILTLVIKIYVTIILIKLSNFHPYGYNRVTEICSLKR